MKLRKIACHDCDLLLSIPALSHKTKAVCPRCGWTITRFIQHGQEKLLVFSLTALIFLVLSLMFPFMTFSLRGTEKVLTLTQAILSIGSEQYFIISSLLFFNAIIIPFVTIVCMIYVLWSFERNVLFKGTSIALKIVLMLLPWSMAEIFFVSVLVSLIKLTALANISFGPSLYCYLFLILCLSVGRLYFDQYQLWSCYRLKLRQQRHAH